MPKISIEICLKKGNKKDKEYGKAYRRNMSEKDKQKKEKIHERIQKKSIQQCVEENKRKQ